MFCNNLASHAQRFCGKQESWDPTVSFGTVRTHSVQQEEDVIIAVCLKMCVLEPPVWDDLDIQFTFDIKKA